LLYDKEEEKADMEDTEIQPKPLPNRRSHAGIVKNSPTTEIYIFQMNPQRATLITSYTFTETGNPSIIHVVDKPSTSKEMKLQGSRCMAGNK
jgi:hypothetical protein